MWYLSVFAFLVASALGQEAPPPTVTIGQGTVVGSINEDGEFYEFYGIPYADSTSGHHRFKAPNPAPSFEETFVADRKNIKCVHAVGTGFEGTEDCLVVNVLTPSLATTSNLPVMVWIKGREFDKVDDYELSFKNFLEQDVIIVVINYRESILGFLCLGTETAPGNAGLKDITAGLRWVQQNIVQFGGNPNNVILFGHGSGAAAVDLVTMSPLANGLVHKAIAQSGSAMAPWAVTRDNMEYAIKVAEALGHTVTSVDQLSEIFTRTSIAALMAVINELDLTDNSLAFAPCIERDNLEGVEPFLVKSPYQTIIDGEFLQIPFMTGYVDNEGTIRGEEALGNNWLERMDTSFQEFLQPDLKFENNEQQEQVAQEIKNFYFGENPVGIDEYVWYHGDTMILVSTIREVRLRSAVSTYPTYLYQFSYKGSLGEPFVGPLVVETAAHSEELAYLFHNVQDLPNNSDTDMDLAISDVLIERWTNFAKTGVPISQTSQIPWLPFTNANPAYLRVLDTEEMSNGALEVNLVNPNPETVQFWNEIYEEHFLDAEGNWELNDRNEEDDEVIDGSGDGDAGGDGADGGEPEPEEDENIEPEEDGEDEPDADSASTAVGYTFVIIALFTVLGHIHEMQVLS